MGNEQDQQSPLTALGRKATRYRVKVSAARFFRMWTDLLVPGTVLVLTLQLFGKYVWPPLAYAGWGLPFWALFCVVFLVTRRQGWLPSVDQVHAVIDRFTGNRGLYMGIAESSDVRWADNLGSTVARLKVKFPFIAASKLAGLIAAVVVVSMLPRSTGSPGTGDIPAPRPVQETGDLIREMGDDEIIDQQLQEKSRELVSAMEKEGADEFGADDWQALDELRETLKRESTKTLHEAADLQRRAEKLRRRLSNAKKGLSAESALSSARLLRSEQVERMLNKQSKQKTLKSVSQEELEKLLKKLRRAGKSGKAGLTSAERENLKKLLKAVSGKCGKRAGKAKACLAQLGMRSGAGGKKASGSGKTGLHGTKPGKGGISRGPGSTPVQHSGETDDNFGSFEPGLFSGNNEAAPEVRLGKVVAPPDENAGKEAVEDAEVVSGSRDFKEGDRRITHHSRLLPRHNDVVKSYFSDQ